MCSSSSDLPNPLPHSPPRSFSSPPPPAVSAVITTIHHHRHPHSIAAAPPPPSHQEGRVRWFIVVIDLGCVWHTKGCSFLWQPPNKGAVSIVTATGVDKGAVVITESAHGCVWLDKNMFRVRLAAVKQKKRALGLAEMHKRCVWLAGNTIKECLVWQFHQKGRLADVGSRRVRLDLRLQDYGAFGCRDSR
ncbi:hypothetical protein Tco_1512936 [Tanacetum coccineum]